MSIQNNMSFPLRIFFCEPYLYLDLLPLMFFKIKGCNQMSCGGYFELVFLIWGVDLVKHFGSIYNNSMHSILNSGCIISPIVTENLILVYSSIFYVNFKVGANVKPTYIIQL